MAIVLCDGFDHYDGVPIISGKVKFPKDNDNYGFSFVDEDGIKIEVKIERRPNGSWGMIINDKAEMIFAERPCFLASVL